VQRKRKQKGAHRHLAILVNESAGRYENAPIDRLIKAIRQAEGQYTIFRPGSAAAFIDTAKAACGHKRSRRYLPPQFNRRGKVTGLVACGGDGSFNLAARVALKADIPIGVIPMGRYNDIAHSLYGDLNHQVAIEKIMAQSYHLIDVGTIGDQQFFGSVGLGLIPHLARLLSRRKPPRFSLGWNGLAAQAAAAVRQKKTVIKVDAFRFETTPTVLSVNLLPYTLGLPLTTSSLNDDRHAEILFDVEATPKELASFVRLISKKKYYYGSKVRLYRGREITLQPARGRVLYLDGELIELPDNVLQIETGSKQLKVFI